MNVGLVQEVLDSNSHCLCSMHLKIADLHA